jgi:glucose-6-phosphate isomerase
MKVLEPKVWHRIPEGIVEGEGVQYYKKYLKDVESLYKGKDTSNYDQDTVVYDVYSYGQGDEKQQGNLFWGLTIIHPIYIENECNMTRGHFHQDRNCTEYYFGIEGEGLLLFLNDQGEMWAEKVLPGSLHYIDGNLAHRLVNIGETSLKVGACWPTTAGHNYSAIEEKGFPYRVYKYNKKIEFIEK